jgi:hypothetical protein
MKTLFVTTIALAAFAATPLAMAAEYNGNQVVCFDPVTGTPHENPAACARFVGELVGAGFNGPGQGAQYFTEMGMVGKNDRSLTPADIMRGPTRDAGACTTHAKDIP